MVEKMEDFVGEYTVASSSKSMEDNFLWAFACIYGLNLDNIIRLLWEELARIHNLWDLSWCIGGDFNVIKFPSERSEGSQMCLVMTKFSACIFNLNLVDLPLIEKPHGPIIRRDLD